MLLFGPKLLIKTSWVIKLIYWLLEGFSNSSVILDAFSLPKFSISNSIVTVSPSDMILSSPILMYSEPTDVYAPSGDATKISPKYGILFWKHWYKTPFM